MTAPFSLDAERGLVARLLVDPSQLSAVQLDPSDIVDPDARAAYAAMRALAQREKPIDIVTIRREIGRSIDIDPLDLTAGHRAPLTAYADVIARDAWRRRYINKMDVLSANARSETDIAVLVGSLQSAATVLEDESEPLLSGRAGDALGVADLERFRQPPPAPLLGVLSPDGTTILYGDGGDGKGWVAAKWAASLGKGKVAILDFEAHPGEWAYRFDKFGLSLDQVVYVSPATTFDRWATEQAARFLRAEGVEYLVIDSAMYASDTDDPYSPSGALAYGRARRRLDNLPALLLAHTTGNQDKVFGSVFWRNESRLVWRLSKDVLRQRHLECRKANNYQSLEGRKFTIEFSEDRGVLNLHEHGKPWGQGITEPEGEDF